MTDIRFALLGEGSTEKGLLPHLRTLCFRAGADVAEGLWAQDLLAHLGKDKSTVSARVKILLEAEPEIDLIFIHRDADKDGNEAVSARRTEIVQGMAENGQGKPFVPVIPIRETEAWLLLDDTAIRRAVGNPSGKAELGLPPLRQIEQRAKPKEVLKDALRKASKPGRRNTIDERTFGRLRSQLLEDLDIDGPVTQLTAWQSLLSDLDAALVHLALLRSS